MLCQVTWYWLGVAFRFVVLGMTEVQFAYFWCRSSNLLVSLGFRCYGAWISCSQRCLGTQQILHGLASARIYYNRRSAIRTSDAVLQCATLRRAILTSMCRVWWRNVDVMYHEWHIFASLNMDLYSVVASCGTLGAIVTSDSLVIRARFVRVLILK